MADQTVIKAAQLLSATVDPYLTGISTTKEEQQEALAELRTAQAHDAANQVIANMQADIAAIKAEIVGATSSSNATQVALEQAVTQAGNRIPYDLVSELSARKRLASFIADGTSAELEALNNELAQAQEMLSAAQTIVDKKFN